MGLKLSFVHINIINFTKRTIFYKYIKLSALLMQAESKQTTNLIAILQVLFCTQTKPHYRLSNKSKTFSPLHGIIFSNKSGFNVNYNV